MEIIKIGTKGKDSKWYGICKYCESEAIALTSELKNLNIYSKPEHPFSWEKCPVCEYTGGLSMLFEPYDNSKKPQLKNKE